MMTSKRFIESTPLLENGFNKFCERTKKEIEKLEIKHESDP